MAEDNNNKKQILYMPELPTTVKGDGRYVLSLLRKYLKSVNEQVNIANGFTEDEVEENKKGDFTRPRNFTLTFDRMGGVLNWDAVPDSNLAYYELRINDSIGTENGLLEKTTATSSIQLPLTASGKIYLYAVSTEGKVSNPNTLTYNKRRPDAPRDISLTKNNEGTLITFLEIPTNCIGANIYIDGAKYESLDNLYLYPDKSITEVAIAYFDQFGEGELARFSCIVPNVTGFYVEKNDANLYFYWDSVPVYNVTYVVKIGITNRWEEGVEIFRSKTNKHRYIRPNQSKTYFMIKAVDDHNNYSKESAWFYLNTTLEIKKNIVLNFDQEKVGYSGGKLNMYYNVARHGLNLEPQTFKGEYFIYNVLPQKIKARNWIDDKINGLSDNNLRVMDLTFTLDSKEAERFLLNGLAGDITNVTLKKQIARYTGKNNDYFNAIVDGTTAVKNGTKKEEHKVSMAFTRFDKGALITDVTRLVYACNVPSTFSMSFWIKSTNKLTDCFLVILYNSETNKKLYIGYDSHDKAFYARDNMQSKTVFVPIDTNDRDWVFIGLSQSSSTRMLYINEYNYGLKNVVTEQITPCGTFDTIYLNPKE